MTSLDHDTAEADAATEALILQLIGQDFGQEVPQTLLGTDHHEGNSHWNNQSSDSQWNIQDPDNQCDIPGSDIEDQSSKPSDNQTALLAEEELAGSCSSSPDSSKSTTLNIEDQDEEMPKRTRRNEDLESDGDATGSDVPVHADLYGSNDSRRPSGNTTNKRPKVDTNAAKDWNATVAIASPVSMGSSNSHLEGGGVAVPEDVDQDAPDHDPNLVSEDPTDADNTTQAIPPAAGTSDQGEDDGDNEDFEGDSEDSESDSEDSEADSYGDEEEPGDLDAMDALSIRDENDEDSTESEDEDIDPASNDVSQLETLKPDTYKPKPSATLRPASYRPSQRANTDKANNEDKIPYFEIPWPGVPGWMESYVYENSGLSFEDYGGHGGRRRRGGPSLMHMLQNQQRMREEEPVDIILEEHETADWLIEEMIRKEEQAKREAKGKGKAVD